MAYVIYLGITHLPPSLLSLLKPERQQQDCRTLRLIKPEFAGNVWREEEGEERSVEERKTYLGSRQKLGHGLQEWQLLQHTPISVI